MPILRVPYHTMPVEVALRVFKTKKVICELTRRTTWPDCGLFLPEYESLLLQISCDHRLPLVLTGDRKADKMSTAWQEHVLKNAMKMYKHLDYPYEY